MSWRPVFDADYDLARLAFLLADLPGRVLGRFRSDRVFRLPAPPRPVGTIGQPNTAVSSNSQLRPARHLPSNPASPCTRAAGS